MADTPSSPTVTGVCREKPGYPLTTPLYLAQLSFLPMVSLSTLTAAPLCLFSAEVTMLWIKGSSSLLDRQVCFRWCSLMLGVYGLRLSWPLDLSA